MTIIFCAGEIFCLIITYKKIFDNEMFFFSVQAAKIPLENQWDILEETCISSDDEFEFIILSKRSEHLRRKIRLEKKLG